jgi:hypothetical protein
MEAFTGSDLPAARLPYCGQGWQAGFRVTPNREPLNPEPPNGYFVILHIVLHGHVP